MSLFPKILSKFKMQPNPETADQWGDPEEYCPNCNATLTKQPGYSPDLDYWECKSCNTMLTNPNSPFFANSEIVWRCDNCEAFLNAQEGFTDKAKNWTCTKCGYVNQISEDEVFSTENDYRESRRDPFRGLRDEEILELAEYKELETISEDKKVSIVLDEESNVKYVRKNLTYYDIDVFRAIKDRPIEGMPRVIKFFESKNNLILIEEYIEGQSLAKLIGADGLILEGSQGNMSKLQYSVGILSDLCDIVSGLHSFNPPIIHRDIKPGNVIISENGKIYLLDMDVAKIYDGGKSEDTILMGTRGYAAPEQYGFGESSVRTDIFHLGELLNELLTGRLPRDGTAKGAAGTIIEKCTRIDPRDRYESVASLKQDITELVTKMQL